VDDANAAWWAPASPTGAASVGTLPGFLEQDRHLGIWGFESKVRAILLAAGCASVTPTREISSGYAIFDINAGPGIGPARIAEAVKVALQKNVSQINIVNGIPPSPLPEKAPRFQLVSPFKGSNLGALAAASGQNLQLPACDGAIVTANAATLRWRATVRGRRFSRA
jgi:hypothetical protein